MVAKSLSFNHKGDAPAKPPQIITTNTLSNIKLPVLQKDDYDTWAMEMEHYLEYIDNEVWKVIQNGNSKKRVTKGKDGVYRVLPPTTQEEQFADEKERKARTLLLMAVPKDHLRRFHGMDDAKRDLGSHQDTVEQTADEELNHALMAFTVNNEKLESQLRASHKQQSSLTKKLNFQANQIFEKDEKLKKYRRIGMKAVKDKDALQKIVDSWFASSKNLWKLIDCGMSSTVKIGLGYGIQSNAEVLGYEEEISRGIFAFRETDAGYYDIPLYSRFKQVEYKGVPHPLSGDYTPREQEDIDDSLYEYGKYGPQPQSPSPTVSDASSTHYSTCPSNDSDGELGAVSDHSVNDDPIHDHIPIPSIEQVTIATQKTQPQVPKPKQTVVPSCAQHVKTPRQPIRTPVTPSPIPSNNRQNWNPRMERELGAGYSFERKPCFVCGSLSHLIKDCDYYEKKMAREAALKSQRVVHANVRQATPAWTNTNRVNKANQFTPRPVNVRPNLSTASKTIKTGRVNVNTGHGNVNSGSVHVNSGTQIKSGSSRFNTGKQHVNSGSVHVNSGTQIKSGSSRFNTGKQNVNSGSVHVNTARVNRSVSNQTSNKTSPKLSQVNLKSPKKCFSKQSSPVNRPFSRNTAHKSNKYAVKGKMGTAVKTSAGCVWRKVIPLSNTNSGPTPDSNVNDHPLKHMEHRGIFDSGCSGHMTGNRAHLEDYQELSKVGSVTFGGSKGSISGKGTIRLGNLVFDDVAFVKELGHFNLFSISQICDKKLNVLFTEKECFVVSSDFKMPDENQVLLKVPRQHNMYTFDMKNVDSSKGYTCLLAKASSDEAKLWHRRLGHLNFKNLNKLVKGNLVRGLPSKSFKNDHTCVACQKGKQHKASCKAKIDRYVTHPLHTLHMDLFGPTSVRSINHASYCLVITDDCSRFCWVFFLAKKDETSDILKTFIRQIENQLNQKVKIIRSDNGTEFKNRVMLEFCGEKGIKQEFSNARTPQQNGVAERMNRTLIEAARTMLADSHLPTTFWAEAVNTACYTFNRVRVTKPQNKTPYELLFGHKPILSYIRPFGCHVTILNTLSPLGKFDGKSDEGFLVGYSVNSKAFRVYNLVTKRVEVNLHVNFLEEKPNVQGIGHRWMFDLDYLTDSMNYIPVSLQNQANPAGSKEVIDIDVQTEEAADLMVVSSTSLTEATRKAAVSEKIATKKTHSPKQPSSTPISKSADDIMTFRKELDALALKHLGPVPATAPTSTNPVNTGSDNLNTVLRRLIMAILKIFSPSVDHEEEVFSDADDDEMPEIRIYDKSSEGIFERLLMMMMDGFWIFKNNNLPDEVESTYKHTKEAIIKINNIVFLLAFLSQYEPRKVSEALEDRSWVEAMQEELNKKDERFQMSSMGELTFFLGLQVKQNKEGIFISQDNMCLFTFSGNSKDFSTHAVQEDLQDLKGKPNLGLMVSLGNHPLIWKHSLIVTMVVPTLTGNPQQDKTSSQSSNPALTSPPPPIPSPTPTPIPTSTSPPQTIPSPTPPPIPTPTSPPPPPPETEPSTDEHIYEEQSPVHHHFSPSQAQAPSHMPTDDLLRPVSQTATPPTTKAHASGEEQEEEISPNTLEAAKTLSKVASLKSRSIDKGRRYKRRKESTGKKVVSSLDFQEDNTGAKKINTADSTAGENKGQREGNLLCSVKNLKKQREQIYKKKPSLQKL
ncbi:putative ribonuclease H-like domain-containing protein [Tanacetum coccineum]